MQLSLTRSKLDAVVVGEEGVAIMLTRRACGRGGGT